MVNIIESHILVEPEKTRDTVLVLKLVLVHPTRIVVVSLNLGLPDHWSNWHGKPVRFYQLTHGYGLEFLSLLGSSSTRRIFYGTYLLLNLLFNIELLFLFLLIAIDYDVFAGLHLFRFGLLQLGGGERRNVFFD